MQATSTVSGLMVLPRPLSLNLPSSLVLMKIGQPPCAMTFTRTAASGRRFDTSLASPKNGAPFSWSSNSASESPAGSLTGEKIRPAQAAAAIRADTRIPCSFPSAQKEAAEKIDESQHDEKRDHPAEPHRRGPTPGERQRDEACRNGAEPGGGEPAIPVHRRPGP